MVNPIYQQDEELLLNPFGSKYLAVGEHTDVNSSEFIVQEDTVISVLTGGDSSISENTIDYKASMNLSGVTLKGGALIVAPVGESFQRITIDSGSILAYNSVKEGSKVTPFSFGNALEFDGINDYVSTGGDVGSSASKLTLSFWTKRQSNGINTAIGSLIDSYHGWWFNWYIDNNIYISFRNGSNNSAVIANTSDINVWTHFFVVYDGTQITENDKVKLYKNGVYQNISHSKTAPSSLSATGGTNFQIGALNGASFSDGVFDETAVWVGTAGTAQNALDLYNNGDGALASSVIDSPNRYYRMNESGADLTTKDIGTDEQDGTLNGFTRLPEYWVAH